MCSSDLTLSPPGWRLTEEALAAAVTPKTKAVMINSPLNPIGRVFDTHEMAAMARVLANSNAVAICDEVYEHLTYNGRPHIPLATLAGMRERTVRIGSAGKIFSLTGWKVGWLTGPRALISVIAKAHQFLTFTTSPALQLGIAHGIGEDAAAVGGNPHRVRPSLQEIAHRGLLCTVLVIAETRHGMPLAIGVAIDRAGLTTASP